MDKKSAMLICLVDQKFRELSLAFISYHFLFSELNDALSS